MPVSQAMPAALSSRPAVTRGRGPYFGMSLTALTLAPTAVNTSIGRRATPDSMAE